MGKNENEKTINDLCKLVRDSIDQNTNLHKELKEELKTIKDDIAKQIFKLQQENEELKEVNKKLESKLKDVERKQKKFNLVVYGVQGEENETQASVLNIFNNNLKINCTETDLRDVIRIGKPIPDKPRPVVIELISYRKKIDILKNVGKLKNTGIFIDHYYISEDYQNKQFLRGQWKIAKEKYPDAKIKKNTLTFNNESHTLEQLKQNSLVSILKAEGNQQSRKEGRGKATQVEEEMAKRSSSRTQRK